MDNKISKEFAEILGLLCAEGSHIISYSSYWEINGLKKRYRKDKRSERIEFYSKDINLANHYISLLDKEFGFTFKITKHGKINIGNRAIIKSIINQTPLGHLKWQVPNSVIDSNKEIKVFFLRGFFDGDGTAINIVRMFSTNKNGIDQLSFLLSNLNYKHTIQGPIIRPKRKPHYVLQLSRKDQIRFLEEINPISKLPKLRK
jgi:intein/homing endonuclease